MEESQFFPESLCMHVGAGHQCGTGAKVPEHSYSSLPRADSWPAVVPALAKVRSFTWSQFG